MESHTINSNRGKAVVLLTGGIINFFKLNNGNGAEISASCVICAPWHGQCSMGPRNGYLKYLSAGGYAISERTAFFHFYFPGDSCYPWRIDLTTGAVIDDSLKISLLMQRDETDEAPGLAPLNPGFSLCFAGDIGQTREFVDGREVGRFPMAIWPLRKEAAIKTRGKEIIIELKKGFNENSRVIFRNDSNGFYFVEPLLGNPENFNSKNGNYLKTGEKLELAIRLTTSD